MPTEVAPIAPHAGPAGRAAGIMFVTTEGETLLLRRGDGGDFPRTFGFPGGHLEEGETLEQAARREALEETGYDYQGDLTSLCDTGQFATFLARGVEKFEVTLCDESTGFAWARPEEAPSPLHPGCDRAFRIAAARTELDIARLIRDGDLPSPQPFGGSMYFALRITGTGHAYRSKDEEHAWRDPSLYLNDEFLARCNGLPVIWQHFEDGVWLQTNTFAESVVGMIMLPYIQGEEVWGIARIIDAGAAKKMATVQLSTSPNHVFDSESGNVKVPLSSTANVLIEGNPILIDHLAVCEQGVWDKGGPPEGVQVDQLKEVSPMADEAGDKGTQPNLSSNDIMQAIAALGTTLAARMDSVSTGLTARMDSLEKNMPAKPLSAAADSEEEIKAKKDAEEAQAKKDADEAEAKAKKDAEDKKKAEEDCKMDAEEAEAKADAQAFADSVYQMHSQSAPRPMAGERLMAYRARLARGMQAHSAAYKDSNLVAIGDAVAFSAVEKAIYADAAKASMAIGASPTGELRAIRRTDQDTGHRITTYAGRAGAWMDDFRLLPRRLRDNTINIAKKGPLQ